MTFKSNSNKNLLGFSFDFKILVYDFEIFTDLDGSAIG